MKHILANLQKCRLFLLRPRPTCEREPIRRVVAPSISALLSATTGDFLANLGPLIRSLFVSFGQRFLLLSGPRTLLLIIAEDALRCALNGILCTLRQDFADVVPEIARNVAFTRLATDVVVDFLLADIVLLTVL
jgi:hypothetical protein